MSYNQKISYILLCLYKRWMLCTTTTWIHYYYNRRSRSRRFYCIVSYMVQYLLLSYVPNELLLHRGIREQRWCGSGCGTSRLAMMCFNVGGQGRRCQIRTAICENDPISLNQSMWIPLAGHTPPIDGWEVYAHDWTRLEQHSNCLCHIFPKPQFIEYAYHHVKLPLAPHQIPIVYSIAYLNATMFLSE